MPRRNQHIRLTQDDSRIIGIPIEDGDTSADWIDPTTANEILYRITDRSGGGEELITLDTTDGNLTTVAAEDALSGSEDKPTDLDGVPDTQNIVRIKLSASDTETLPVGQLHHECELQGINSSESTVMTGTVQVQRSST